MTRFGYFLACEEHGPDELLRQARWAEEAGFDELWISDHYHPWNDEQGQSPFVWSVIGALSVVTDLPVTTGVTCPTVRIHPAVVAHAAATSAVMLDGRFRLGVGTGEALNEHVTGQVWPPAQVRLEMLEESVEVMRQLWTGETLTHRGRHFTVHDARLYTVPEQPPEVIVSAFGPRSARRAAAFGDGFVTTSPDPDLLTAYREGEDGAPGGGGVSVVGTRVCWAPDHDEAVQIGHRLWGNSGLPGELAQVLPSPKHFEQGTRLVTREQTAASMVCGPDVEAHVAALREGVDAGFDEVYVQCVGPYAQQMLEVYGREVLPALR